MERMTHASRGGGPYSDRETALILKLASELDADSSVGEGHLLAEIQEIAAEAGIDAEFVLQAAHALRARRTAGATLAGAPTSYQFQRTLEGELSDGELGELLSTIRRFTDEEGQVVRVLDSVEWRASDARGGTTHVELTRRAGQTGIRVKGSYSNVAAWPYLWAGVIAAIASIVAGTEIQATILTEAGIIAGLWGSAYLGARAVWRSMAAKLEGRLKGLLGALTAQASRALGPASPPPALDTNRPPQTES
jgi:hypothetical protein